MGGWEGGRLLNRRLVSFHELSLSPSMPSSSITDPPSGGSPVEGHDTEAEQPLGGITFGSASPGEYAPVVSLAKSSHVEP